MPSSYRDALASEKPSSKSVVSLETPGTTSDGPDQSASLLTGSGIAVPLQVARPKMTVIDAMTTGWTNTGSSGTLSTVTDTSPFAQSVQRVVSPGAGTNQIINKTLGAAVDMTGKQLGVMVRSADLSHLKQIDFFFGDSAFTNYFQWTQAVFSNGATTGFLSNNEWVPLIVPWNPTSTGSPLRNAVQRIKVVVVDDAAGTPVTVDLGGVFTIPESSLFPNGVVSITIDDDGAGLLPIMAAKLGQYGYPATLFPIGEYLGASGRSTLSDYRALEAAGWEIGAHASSLADHVSFPSLPQSERLANLARTRAWHDANGFPTETFAWPVGAKDAASIADVRRFYSVARGTGSAIETLPPAKPYYLRGITALQPGANVLEGWNTKIKAALSWGIFVFHSASTGGTLSSQDTATARFQSFVDDLNTKGIEVRTIRDVLRRVNGAA